MKKHSWPADINSAKHLQRELSKKVIIKPLRKEPTYIAGVDAAFHGNVVRAVASLFEFPSLHHVEDAVHEQEITFPYIPGLLSFREGESFINAVRKLEHRPDVIIVDGQGIAHPLGIGIASHIGVLLSLPTIGCAKKRLVGDYKEPGPEKGDRSLLTYKNKQIGAVLRTRTNVKPVFVSPGHLIDLDTSIEIVLGSVTKYKLPEPIRRADRLSKE